MLGVAQGTQPLTDGLGERRRSERFPIVRDVRYRVNSGRGESKSGIGTTANVSSGGVLFTAPEALAPRKRIELSISWPAQLDGKCALRLVARGRIMRGWDPNVAVEIENHEFRTQSSRQLMPAWSPTPRPS
jgi:hypothetical protein